jgi:hypothetical protein
VTTEEKEELNHGKQLAVTVLRKHRIYYVRRDVNYELDRTATVRLFASACS